MGGWELGGGGSDDDYDVALLFSLYFAIDADVGCGLKHCSRCFFSSYSSSSS